MKKETSENSRFVILGEHGSYIIKDIVERRYVASGIETMQLAVKMKKAYESAWSYNESDEIDAGTVAALVSSLTEAVSLYGKSGGPWNVPNDPGGWLWRAKEALRKAGVNMDASKEIHDAEDCEDCWRGVPCGNTFCPNRDVESLGHS